MKGQPYYGFRTKLREALTNAWIERRIDERRKAGEKESEMENGLDQ